MCTPWPKSSNNFFHSYFSPGNVRISCKIIIRGLFMGLFDYNLIQVLTYCLLYYHKKDTTDNYFRNYVSMLQILAEKIVVLFTFNTFAPIEHAYFQNRGTMETLSDIHFVTLWMLSTMIYAVANPNGEHWYVLVNTTFRFTTMTFIPKLFEHTPTTKLYVGHSI